MAITFDEVCAKIRKTVRGRAADTLVIEEDSEFADLGLSSLQIADLVYGLEDSLGIVLDPARAADVRTVGDLVALANSTAANRA
jgi:acyl carrier protein